MALFKKALANEKYESVGAIADDDIELLIIRQKTLQQVVFALGSNVIRYFENAVLQKDGKPAQNVVFLSRKIQNRQVCHIEMIGVGVTAAFLCTRPLLCKLKTLCAIEAKSVIVTRVTFAENRSTDDFLQSRDTVLIHSFALTSNSIIISLQRHFVNKKRR